jgi:SAM-dependent methyltransferase
VISTGVINLCADKRAVLDEIHLVLRPGGVLQFADIANGRTGAVLGGQPGARSADTSPLALR